VAIISILAAMLLPALSKARKRALDTGCMGNIRTLGLATEMYADDMGEWYPLNTAADCPSLRAAFPLPNSLFSGTDCWWAFKLWSYANETRLYVCTDSAMIAHTAYRGTVSVATSYGWNTSMSVKSKKRSGVRFAGETYLLGHNSTAEDKAQIFSGMVGGSTTGVWWPGWHGTRLDSPPIMLAGKCGFLFADGRGEFLTLQDALNHPEYFTN
jgi:type II secretory pathway pseudopilin PulG